MPTQQQWDQQWITVAQVTSKLSKDPSTKVGAVIVSSDNRKLSVGYNGFAKGIVETADMWNIRETKYEMVIHAEENALLNVPFDVKDCSLYCTHQPCHRCLIRIANSGIVKVVYALEYARLTHKDIWDMHAKLFKEIYLFKPE
jgi:dCMP deaminase